MVSFLSFFFLLRVRSSPRAYFTLRLMLMVPPSSPASLELPRCQRFSFLTWKNGNCEKFATFKYRCRAFHCHLALFCIYAIVNWMFSHCDLKNLIVLAWANQHYHGTWINTKFLRKMYWSFLKLFINKFFFVFSTILHSWTATIAYCQDLKMLNDNSWNSSKVCMEIEYLVSFVINKPIHFIQDYRPTRF